MTAGLILLCVGLYTLLLFGVTWWTARGANNESYFVGNRSSRWYVVAYGMIGASLSGVTFMSVPGNVGSGGGGSHFYYFQVVLGYLLGYMVIAYVLLPLYYRMNLTSIYTYLEKRFGVHAYRTGAFFFILSRVLGAACRMYIVVLVLQKFVFEGFGMPFGLTTAIFILLILAYTFKGGVKTIVWTDALQTTFMILSLVLSVILISKTLHIPGLFHHISTSEYSKIFNTNWKAGLYFPKAFFGGMFIAITMTGMDQEMMQKNISCKTVGDAQKNVITFSVIMVLVNLLFLALGVLIWDYVAAHPELQAALNPKTDPATGKMIGEKLLTDELFPTIALHGFGTVSALFFVIGLISAAYPSADGALTALTSSFCIDFLGFKEPGKGWTEERQVRVRKIVHVCFAILLFTVMMILKAVNDQAIIDIILFLATITYGPLLGLFAFGLLTKRTVKGWPVIVMCAIAPFLCYVLNFISSHDASFPHSPGAVTFNVFNGYRFGNELLIINGLLTFLGLLAISQKAPAVRAS